MTTMTLYGLKYVHTQSLKTANLMTPAHLHETHWLAQYHSGKTGKDVVFKSVDNLSIK